MDISLKWRRDNKMTRRLTLVSVIWLDLSFKKPSAESAFLSLFFQDVFWIILLKKQVPETHKQTDWHACFPLQTTVKKLSKSQSLFLARFLLLPYETSTDVSVWSQMSLSGQINKSHILQLSRKKKNKGIQICKHFVTEKNRWIHILCFWPHTFFT